MQNLLNETLIDIKKSGHTVEDINFVGSQTGEYSCSWATFEELADADYNPECFSVQKVATDLIIIFTDGQRMCRTEHNGAESWHYTKPFKISPNPKPIKSLFSDLLGWEKLSNIHGDERSGKNNMKEGRTNIANRYFYRKKCYSHVIQTSNNGFIDNIILKKILGFFLLPLSPN